MTPTIHLISTVISIVATFGAFAVWILRHMDRHLDRRFAEFKADTQRQFAEAKADTQRQFAEAKADTQRQFAEFKADTHEFKADTQRQFAEAKADTQRQFAEAKADTQRQFDELKAEMWRGFEQAREDRLRMEKKMEDKFELHGEQIAGLRQDVGRLQGIVERTHQPRRFTALSAQSALSTGDEVRETRIPYAVGPGEEDAGHGEEDPGYGGGGTASGGESGRDGES